MSNLDQTIGGGPELDELLQTLPTKVEKNILRTAMRAGAAVFLQQVKANIPVGDGNLRDSARITTRAKRGQVSASVKVGNSQVYYANMVEYGTRPHLISATDEDRGRNRKGGIASMTTLNRRLRIGGTIVGPVVAHPGARPRPFMRPAADAGFTAAVAAVRDKVRERLTKQGLNTPAPLPMDPSE